MLAVAVLVAATAWAVVVKGSGPPPQSTHRHLVNQATAADVRATRDRFGIRYLEPTLPRGNYWVSHWQGRRSFGGVDPRDTWFDAEHGSGASYRVDDGLLYISGPVPRMFVHDPALKRQWHDVEVTMYVKRVADGNVPYAGMTAVARSNHLADSPKCDTRGYGARVRYDGFTDFEKETSHPANEAHAQQQVWRQGMPYDTWIGFKFVVFDRRDGVHLQTWLDMSDGRHGGDWVLANQMTDDGHVFGRSACAPGIDPQLELTASSRRPGSESGKPNVSVYFRSDEVHRDGLVYKWGSVREIRPR
jgi:hypothetical protein